MVWWIYCGRTLRLHVKNCFQFTETFFPDLYPDFLRVALITLCTPTTEVEALFLLHLQQTDRLLSLCLLVFIVCFPVTCGVCGIVPFSPLWLSRSSAAASLTRHNALTCVHVRAT